MLTNCPNCGAPLETDGYKGAAQASGYKASAAAYDPESIAVAWGYKSRAKGVKGSFLVLTEWIGNEDHYWAQEEWALKKVRLVHIDGKKYKPDVYYELIDGKVVERRIQNDIIERR